MRYITYSLLSCCLLCTALTTLKAQQSVKGTMKLSGDADIVSDSKFYVQFKSIENPSVNKVLPDPARIRMKNQLTEAASGQSKRASNNDSIKIITSYRANGFNNNTPMDNNIAISNNGLTVSVVNVNLQVYDSNGTALQTRSFNSTFFGDPSLTSIIYDPKILYDPEHDRFILVVLHGSTPATSRVLVCFSKSGNPHIDGWKVYQLQGNPFSNNLWFDYPNIAISKSELFISGNLFEPDGGGNNTFRNTVVFQVNKLQGYQGVTNVDILTWGGATAAASIKDGDGNIPFTIVPAGYGRFGNYGEGIYMVSSRTNGGNKLYLYSISADQYNAPKLTASTISVASYNDERFCSQKGTATLLNSGDCRMKNAFFLDGILHCVLSGRVTGAFSGIIYNRIDVNSKVSVSRQYEETGTDYAYPAVVSFSNDSLNKSVLIAAVSTSSQKYPDIVVIGCDDQMIFSQPRLIKAGESFVSLLPQNGSTRWGDYTGVAKRFSAPYPEVVVSGSYGVNQTSAMGSRIWNNWNARITTRDVQDKNAAAGATAILYPNPAPSQTEIKLELHFSQSGKADIRLYDMTGREVKTIYNDVVLQGKSILVFNTEDFAPGRYTVKTWLNQKPADTQNIIIQ